MKLLALADWNVLAQAVNALASPGMNASVLVVPLVGWVGSVVKRMAHLP